MAEQIIVPSRLAQNIQSLIGAIGEQQVLLRLALFCHQHPEWRVYQNVGDSGYDILLETRRKRVPIEVKTRQGMFSVQGKNRAFHFTLTKGEHDRSEFLVAYILDSNDFFIVPTEDLSPVPGGRSWRFSVGRRKDGSFSEHARPFHHAWHLISADLRDCPAL